MGRILRLPRQAEAEDLSGALRERVRGVDPTTTLWPGCGQLFLFNSMSHSSSNWLSHLWWTLVNPVMYTFKYPRRDYKAPRSPRDSLSTLTATASELNSHTDMTSYTFPLATLPRELIVRILGYLPYNDLLRCMEVCKSLCDMSHSVELRYKVELAAAGMEDGSSSALSTADRLRRLEEHQVAWRDLRWKSETVVPMLRGGVWELYGGVLAQSRGRETLVFRQIPSEIRGIEEKVWENEIGFRIRDFGMDPAQDLLVVIESPNGNGIHRIHLLTVSAAKPHPQACRPAVISHSPNGANFSFAIQVSGEHIGVLFIGSTHDSESELLIWNWHTGMLEMALHGRELASFSFLTNQHVLVGFVQAVFLDHPQDPPSLRVYDFENCAKEPVHILDAGYEYALDFPPMQPDGAVLAAAIRSDPSPIWKPSEDLSVPFYTARNDRLFVITCWVAEGHHITTLILYIPSSTVLKYLSIPEKTEENHHFPWDAWGPSGTRMRMAPAGHSMVWVCYVYGQCFVAPYRERTQALTTPRGPKMVQLFNFNQLAVQRAWSRGEQELENTEIITGPSTVQLSVFTQPIQTSLPYLWKKVCVPYHADRTFDAVMLAEDAIITVTSDPDCREYRILSF
ncbi:hypothetical protein NM688_g8037 [Phlebia brevispora]|uniref:Uncharacterized protein n=1 Tax=Phlebia brevispora TaxID=194682 RepID=A0ACC1RY42_9APHY|nr:hypothetical protein NM688_g8037 [Phlebia brevispora]